MPDFFPSRRFTEYECSLVLPPPPLLLSPSLSLSFFSATLAQKPGSLRDSSDAVHVQSQSRMSAISSRAIRYTSRTLALSIKCDASGNKSKKKNGQAWCINEIARLRPPVFLAPRLHSIMTCQTREIGISLFFLLTLRATRRNTVDFFLRRSRSTLSSLDSQIKK